MDPRLLAKKYGDGTTRSRWDTLKAGVRGETILYSSMKRKNEKNLWNIKLLKLAQAEEKLDDVQRLNQGIEKAQENVALAKAEIQGELSKKAIDKGSAHR